MGIWEILGIEPPTDKSQIKKAYTARSKEIHLEERQEEFMQLYAAYQAALQYAQRSRRYQPDGRSGPVTEDGRNTYSGKGKTESGAEKDSTGREAADRTKWKEDELSFYFENRAEERNEKIAFFMEKWENVKSVCRDPGERRWWKDYLKSEDFQDIKWHPALVEFLGEDMELEAVGICKEGALYPDAFVNGGVKGCQPMKEQFYRPWEVESGQMEEMVREGHVGYMFHFEPWNLTPEQYREWGPAYREMCEDIEKDHTSGFWYHLSRENGVNCDLYIPVYSYAGYEAFAEGKYFTKSTDMLLVGDAYFFLMAGGVSPKPAGDGSGFFVEKDGESCFFGENAEEKLSAVRGFINAHE